MVLLAVSVISPSPSWTIKQLKPIAKPAGTVRATLLSPVKTMIFPFSLAVNVCAPESLYIDALKSSIVLALKSTTLDALISIVGAVKSNVVPAFISKCPSADATIFSPPAAS